LVWFNYAKHSNVYLFIQMKTLLKIFKQTIWYLWLLLLFSAAAPTSPLAAQDQSPAWSSQQRIPGYLDDTEPPVLVVDKSGVVHAFAHQQVGDIQQGREIGIIYNTWTYENGWTLPLDIILSPIKQQARVLGVFLDQNDVFHLIFYGGDEVQSRIYYTYALLEEADSAWGWEKPVPIGYSPATPSMGKIIGDNEDGLLVIYSAYIDGPGLFAIRSWDNGLTWSEAEPYFLTYNVFHQPFGLQIESSESNIFHIVWNVIDELGHNVAGYYAQASMRNLNVKKPSEFDIGIGIDKAMGIANPSVTEYENKIYLAYNNGIPPEGVPPTNWVKVSEDGGNTWSDRQRISEKHVGRNGRISFLIDEQNELYAFFGLRIPLGGADAIHGMWYSTFEDGNWLSTEAVVSGPQSTNFDPYDAGVVVSQGNLLATWRTDPGVGKSGVWYSYAVLNSSEAATESLSGIDENASNSEISETDLNGEGDVEPEAGAENIVAIGEEPTSFDFPREDNRQYLEENNSTSVFFKSTVPALFFVVFVIIARFWYISRQKSKM
jgi:hypothetical protein